MLANVSLLLSPVCLEDENTIVGGSDATALKNEYGARLTTPSPDIVDTNAIGRGTTTPVSTR